MPVDRIAEDIDWASVWEARLLASQRKRGGSECSGLWQSRQSVLIKYLGKKLSRSPGGMSLRGVSTMAVISWDVMANRITR